MKCRNYNYQKTLIKIILFLSKLNTFMKQLKLNLILQNNLIEKKLGIKMKFISKIKIKKQVLL